MKTLVVYFTWDGRIKSLAERIAEKTGARLFRINPVNEYPKEKFSLCARVSQELFDGERPEYKEDIDITEYDTVFFGTPIWAHELPPVVRTFIERHDFHGKTVMPFCSCLTSLDAPKVSEITKACKGSAARKGYAFVGTPEGFDLWLDAVYNIHYDFVVG